MQVGDWMRNKETGESAKIISIGAMVGYRIDDVDGEVQATKLSEYFDLLDDPIERVDIEFLLRAKIEAGEAETGLYDLGVSYVVVDKIMTDGKDVVTFQWFDHTIPFSDLIND